jgi:hypothetical protein
LQGGEGAEVLADMAQLKEGVAAQWITRT